MNQKLVMFRFIIRKQVRRCVYTYVHVHVCVCVSSFRLVHAFTCAGILPRQYIHFSLFAHLGTVGK